ncbi:hypothetical protein GCM10010170_101910 [Dactylosporangium salmoneum]|uniref:Uncharacterized protein n=1 Tax=Dactylosporangium salmoneum TaxID=53361 RepID=A0ABN3HY48_9ACTN
MRRLLAALFAFAAIGAGAVWATAGPSGPAAVGTKCFTDAGEVKPCPVKSEPASPSQTP